MNQPITARTRLYGVIGRPIGHSLSPALHNAAFAAAGVDARYVAFDVTPGGLATALDGARALGIRGLNVTVPHKESALAWARARGAAVSAAAAAIGATNTLAFGESGDIAADNTDAAGFLRSLGEHGVELRGRAVTVIGAGGAARAAVWALAGGGASVTIVNRTTERANRLADELTPRLDGDAGPVTVAEFGALDRILGSADLIVNTTPVGMAPETDAVPADLTGAARSGQTVFDMIYRPAETALLRAAGRAGARTVNGLGMLVYQAASAWNLWTGREAPVDAMWQAVREQLGEGG